MKRLLLIIATGLISALAIVFLLITNHHPTPAPKPAVAAQHARPQVIGAQEVCSFDAPPCIKLVTPEQSYGLNDFRLYNRNCIAFVSLPDHVQRSYCGPFSLQWQGPQPQ